MTHCYINENRNQSRLLVGREWSLNLGGDLRSHSGVHMYHEDLKAIDVQHTNCEFLEVLLHSPIYCLHGA